jgi:hypothetical protein
MGKVEGLQEAIKIVDQEESGRPEEKYARGSIQRHNKDLEKSGTGSYIEDVIKTAEERLPELKEEVKETREATFSPNLEYTNPEEYSRQKMEKFEEEEELPVVTEIKTEGIEEKKSRVDNLKEKISKLFN